MITPCRLPKTSSFWRFRPNQLVQTLGAWFPHSSDFFGCYNCGRVQCVHPFGPWKVDWPHQTPVPVRWFSRCSYPWYGRRRWKAWMGMDFYPRRNFYRSPCLCFSLGYPRLSRVSQISFRGRTYVHNTATPTFSCFSMLTCWHIRRCMHHPRTERGYAIQYWRGEVQAQVLVAMPKRLENLCITWGFFLNEDLTSCWPCYQLEYLRERRCRFVLVCCVLNHSKRWPHIRILVIHTNNHQRGE